MLQPVSPKADVGVIVGRFQVDQLHDAHKALIDSVVARHHDGKVIIFLGRSVVQGTFENPLDVEARELMLRELYPTMTICTITDNRSDELWSKELDRRIGEQIAPGQSVILYGSRDSFIKHYAGRFETLELESDSIVSGTSVREACRKRAVQDANFRRGAIWASGQKYPTSYQCVDVAAYDMVRDRILLGRKPGETKFRFFGGFVDPRDNSLEEAARRELREESGSYECGRARYLFSERIDDWRYRRERDKIMTALFWVRYEYGIVEPGDDIEECRWFDREELFDKYQSLLMPEHVHLFDRFVQHFRESIWSEKAELDRINAANAEHAAEIAKTRIAQPMPE